MELPYDPAIPVLGIYPKKPERLTQNNISTPVFIAALFTISKIWKQPKCPSVDEWITTVGYLQSGLLLSSKKANFTVCYSMDGKHYCK